jgi:hypothetical protein
MRTYEQLATSAVKEAEDTGQASLLTKALVYALLAIADEIKSARKGYVR